jgi:hypothetical protein
LRRSHFNSVRSFVTGLDPARASRSGDDRRPSRFSIGGRLASLRQWHVEVENSVGVLRGALLVGVDLASLNSVRVSQP